jgi:hypothetical protein
MPCDVSQTGLGGEADGRSLENKKPATSYVDWLFTYPLYSFVYTVLLQFTHLIVISYSVYAPYPQVSQPALEAINSASISAVQVALQYGQSIFSSLS